MTEQEKKRINEVLESYAEALRILGRGASAIDRERYEFAVDIVECIARDGRMYGEEQAVEFAENIE